VARRPWFRREPIDLGELAVETIAVLLGVLIALAIDGWHENRQDARVVGSADAAVRGEIAANRRAVAAHARRLEAMAARMDAAPATPAARPCMGYPGWAGAEPPLLLDTAYEVAVATGAMAKMPYVQASAIGGTYGAQRYVQGTYDKIGAMLLGERPVGRSQCIGIVREMARASTQLGARYDALLATPPPSP
jgi:hypothetical protein